MRFCCLRHTRHNFNPPTPWGVGPAARVLFVRAAAFQSTHSVGSGTTGRRGQQGSFYISIHPLRGEWDLTSLRRMMHGCNFNPPTPWGVGRKIDKRKNPSSNISIHQLRGEWDEPEQTPKRFLSHFNPPTPWGVGLTLHFDARLRRVISIHPLRGEWDLRFCCLRHTRHNFNPPTPWGVGR